jgi:glycine cleavage system H protein
MPDSPDDLVFAMGEFKARFPVDRLYAKNHVWAKKREDDLWRFGFTAYAVRLLQDVYFLEWSVEPGSLLVEKQEIGAIESKKAESTLYAPLDGRLAAFNLELLRDPSAINVDKYGGGWLYEIEATGQSLLTPADYLLHLESAWVVAQRTIKGQMNE